MEKLVTSVSNAVKYWYIPLIVGILFVVCGIYAFVSPLSTYLALAVLFSVSFIVSGVGDMAFAMANGKALKGWGWYLISGLLSLIMGIYLVAYPQVSMSILPLVVGFTLLFRSCQLLGFSLDLKGSGIKGWGYVTFISVLGILFCFLLLANPIFTSISIVVLTALSFIFIGFAYVILSFNLKKMKPS